jgi:uncharacterized membrane protein YdbT with pleckstrin-like domain
MMGGEAAAPLLQDRRAGAKPRRVGRAVARRYVADREKSMRYVKHVLQDGEQIRHTASLHWILYWPGALCLLAAIGIFVYGRNAHPDSLFWSVIAAVLLLIAVVLLFREWFVWWTTEIAVTNRRIIYKTGFISRDTNEMHMDKVESVKVEQSIPGRILDYGDVTVLGTGTGWETMKKIAAPLELRNHITGM